MEYYAAIRNDEFMSFVGTWMNVETIFLSKLTRTENQTHVLTHRWMLDSENTWMQGGEHHTLGSVGEEIGEGQRWVGSWGGITWGVMPDIGDGEEGSKPHCRVLCMQLFLTCTPKPKMQ